MIAFYSMKKRKYDGLAELYNNVACMYFHEKDFAVAAGFLKKSFELQMQSLRKLMYTTVDDEDKKLREKKKKMMNISMTVANIGVIKLHNNEYDHAILALEDSILVSHVEILCWVKNKN